MKKCLPIYFELVTRSCFLHSSGISLPIFGKSYQIFVIENQMFWSNLPKIGKLIPLECKKT